MREVVLPCFLGLSLFGPTGAAHAGTRQTDGPLACLAIVAEAERLSCYVDRPTRLRYQSDGPIFVLYLKAADGEVLQNLHIGGGGEASYLIEKSGTYFLDVNGSESWRIWLETEPTQSTN